MGRVRVGQVVATRAGEIADESDSEDEESEGEEEKAVFWLCVIVQECKTAVGDDIVKNTTIKKNEKYVVVRWLEKVEGSACEYVLSDVEDCIGRRRVQGLLPLQKLGVIKNLEAKEVKYKLNPSNKKRILAIAKRQ